MLRGSAEGLAEGASIKHGVSPASPGEHGAPGDRQDGEREPTPRVDNPHSPGASRRRTRIRDAQLAVLEARLLLSLLDVGPLEECNLHCLCREACPVCCGNYSCFGSQIARQEG